MNDDQPEQEKSQAEKAREKRLKKFEGQSQSAPRDLSQTSELPSPPSGLPSPPQSGLERAKSSFPPSAPIIAKTSVPRAVSTPGTAAEVATATAKIKPTSQVHLNLVLQRTLLVSLKEADSRAAGGVVFLRSMVEEEAAAPAAVATATGLLLEPQQIDRYMFERMSLLGVHRQHPLAYLFACFARCEAEGRTSSSAKPEIKAALEEAMTVASRYAGLVLTVPGFVPGGDGAVPALCHALLVSSGSVGGFPPPPSPPHSPAAGALASAECAPHLRTFPSFLAAVLRSLAPQDGGGVSEEFGAVVGSLAEGIVSLLRDSQKCKKGGDDASLRASRALATLLAAHKAVAKALAARSDFLVAVPGSPEALAPLPTSVNPLAASMGLHLPTSGRWGPVVERCTLLGALFRPHALTSDPNGTALLPEVFPNPFELHPTALSGAATPLTQPLALLQANQLAVLNSLLKSGPQGKQGAVDWLCDAVAANAGAEASRPDDRKVSSEGFLLNLCAALLGLSAPFLGKASLEAKISLCSLASAHFREAFPPDATRLGLPSSSPPAPAATSAGSSSSGGSSGGGGGGGGEAAQPNFITVCFFLTWRCLSLGPASMLERNSDRERQVWHHFHRARSTGADPTQAVPGLQPLFRKCLCDKALVFEPSFVRSTLSFVGTAARWLVARQKDVDEAEEAVAQASGGKGDDGLESPPPPSAAAAAVAAARAKLHEALAVLSALPEACMSALCTLTIAAVKEHPELCTEACPGTAAAAGGSSPLASLFECCVGFLCRPSLVPKPHLRAQLGELLYEVFLEPEAKPSTDRYLQGQMPRLPPDVAAAHSIMAAGLWRLLRTHPRAQRDLAPALLELYGGVEHIGEEDKFDSRCKTARLLRDLWQSPEHRSTFRRIATAPPTLGVAGAGSGGGGGGGPSSPALTAAAGPAAAGPPARPAAAAAADGEEDEDEDDEAAALEAAMKLSMVDDDQQQQQQQQQAGGGPQSEAAAAASGDGEEEAAAGSTSEFVRFANGLLNEANALVAFAFEHLAEVKALQDQQKDAAAWAALEQEKREELATRLSEAEMKLKWRLPLCAETIDMLTYLCSDPVIRKPFLKPGLLDRVANLLLSVLDRLAGPRGLEIKVSNAEELGFRPRELLRQICQCVVYFSAAAAVGGGRGTTAAAAGAEAGGGGEAGEVEEEEEEEGVMFARACALSAFYTTNPKVLVVSARTVRKHAMLGTDAAASHALAAMDALVGKVDAAASVATAEDEMFDDVPEDFLDPMLYTLMVDPVTLPRGTVCDRSTIEQHLLNAPTDPFSREPLTAAELVPNSALKAKIDAWKDERRRTKATP